MQIPITGAKGTLETTQKAIYIAPKANSGSAYVTIENIYFTNIVDDDPFTITLYQNSRGGSPTVLWSFESVQAKTFVDGNIKRLLVGDSILAICNKTTIQYVINGYYETTNSVNTNPAVNS